MNEAQLSGRVAIVTGAASTIGLGRAMTLALVRAGARVAMMDVDQKMLDESAAAVREVGGPDCIFPIVGDVTDPADAERIVERTIAELGGLHILLNNAGINPTTPPDPEVPIFARVPVDAWMKTMAVNVNGPFFMARAALGHLLRQRWGRIIGVTTSLDTMIRDVPYGPSKAAHEAFIAIMARQLEGSGVTANVLIPGGAVRTNMTSDRWIESMLQPEVMQAPVVWLASEQSNGANGRRIIAQFWDDELPIEERLEKAAAPAGWPQLSRRTS